MRILVPTTVAVAMALVAPAALAGVSDGESQRYGMSRNGLIHLDPCNLPLTAPLATGLGDEDTSLGGACFELDVTGVKLKIEVADDNGGNAYAVWRMLDANGVGLSNNHFCSHTNTVRVPDNAVFLSVSVYLSPRSTPCQNSQGTGVSGLIHVRALVEDSTQSVIA